MSLVQAEWKTALLGDVCENLDKSRVPITKSKRVSGKIPYYGASGIVDYVEDYIFDEELLLVSEDGANLLARTYPIAFTITGKTWVNNHAHVLRFESEDSQKFIEYYLNSISLEPFVSGMAQPKLNQKALNNIPVPFPPLFEKKRIVTILDEAVAAINQAVANAEKNLANARELFESYLNNVFTQKGDGWVDAQIENHIKFIDYRGRTPKKTETGMRLITAKNVKMGFLQLEPREFVDPDTYEEWMTRGIPNKGDVLFTTEAPLGNVTQLDTDDKVVFAQRVIIMQSDGEVLDSSFLKYMLLSNVLQHRIHEKGTGATVKGIKAKLLKKIEISFPKTVIEQKSIVGELDSLLVETQKLEVVYNKKLTALTELKQSILQKAFSGELTADTVLQQANG